MGFFWVGGLGGGGGLLLRCIVILLFFLLGGEIFCSRGGSIGLTEGRDNTEPES